MIIKLLVEGGNMKPGPSVGQKLGPVGINIGQVISEVNKATQSFKGTKVPVTLDIDSSTKKFTIEVSSPPASELLKKELGLEKGSGDHKKEQVANASIEQIISVAKIKHSTGLSKDFKASVKSVVGSALSLGILIESKSPKKVLKEIDEGLYDKEIQEQKTDTSPEKKAKLKRYFDALHKKQEAAIKAEEEAAKAAEEAKAAKPEEGAVEAKEGEAAPASEGEASAAKSEEASGDARKK